MYTEVTNDAPSNAAFSLYQTSGGSRGNSVNFAAREVLISNEMSGRNDWGIKHWGFNQKWEIVLV